MTARKAKNACLSVYEKHLTRIEGILTSTADVLHGTIGAFHKCGLIPILPDAQVDSSLPENEVRRLGGAIFHEYVHWWQYAGTPYGLYCSRLQELQTQCVRWLCHALANGSGCPQQASLHIPLLNWLFAASPEVDSRFAFIVSTCLGTENFLLSLEGYGALGPEEIAEAVLLCDKLLTGGFDFPALLEFPLGHGVDEITVDDVPVASWGNGPFGSLQILESAARLQELVVGWGYDSIDEELLPANYGAAYRPLREMFPSATRREAVMTVLALSDLALWSTIDPIVRERRLESISWRDIHPGRRFLQCVDQLKKVGLMEDEHQYGEFSNALCRNLGWPRIEDLLRIALELRAKTDNPVLESFLACCELRKQIPWAFAFSAHEPALSTLMSKCPPAVAGRDDAHIAPVGMPGKRGLILLIAHDAAWLSRHAAFGSDLALEGLFFMGLPGEDEDRDGLLRQMIKDHLFFGMHDLIFDRNR